MDGAQAGQGAIRAGASFSILPDDSILVGGAHRWKDRYHVELTLGTDINLRAVRLEALTHESLPNHGPGAHPNGSFAQISWNVTATPPSGKGPITLKFDNAWADHQLEGYPIDKNGHWNIYGGHGGNCTAIWSMSRPVSLRRGHDVDVRDAMPDQLVMPPKTSAISACRCPATPPRSKAGARAGGVEVHRSLGKAGSGLSDSKATSGPSTDWSSDVRSWRARSATCSPRGGIRTRTGGVRSRCTAKGSRRRQPTPACSPSGLAPRGAEELGRRRGRLVAGRDRESGRGKIFRRVRATTCCPAARFPLAKAQFEKAEHFTSDRWRRTLKMTWSPRNWLKCCWIGKTMSTRLDGRSSSRRR